MGVTLVKRTMSDAVKRRMSITAKARWAGYHAGKDRPPNMMGRKYARGTGGGRRRRNGNEDNPYLRMAAVKLVRAHHQIMEAWGVLQNTMGMLAKPQDSTPA